MHSLLKLSLLTAIVLLVSCQNSKENRSDEQVDKAEFSSSNPDSGSIDYLENLQKGIQKGEILYQDFCVQCHMADGKGIPGTFPPLANSNWLTDKRKESIHAVKYGQSGEITVNGETYNSVMVAMGLSDEEIADVLNYVMNSWGNSQSKMVTAQEVSEVVK